jgi:hypothetical protein
MKYALRIRGRAALYNQTNPGAGASPAHAAEANGRTGTQPTRSLRVRIPPAAPAHGESIPRPLRTKTGGGKKR